MGKGPRTRRTARGSGRPPVVAATSATRTATGAKGATPASADPGVSDQSVERMVDIGAELAKLDPAQAEMFVEALALTMRKRRTMLLGYLAVLVVIVVGQLAAVVVWANLERGTFRGWVFLVPMALAGGVLLLTGRLVKQHRPRP